MSDLLVETLAKEGRPLSTRDLARRLPLAHRTVLRRLRALEACGQVQRLTERGDYGALRWTATLRGDT